MQNKTTEILLNEINKRFKEHDDEVFKVVTYPRIRENYYCISNYGQLKYLAKDTPIKLFQDKDGYYRAGLLGNDRTSHHCGIHRLVAYEFCEHHDGCNVVNHLNGVKTCNVWTNLEWTTPLENTRHALRTGLQCNSGPHCPSAVYSEETVRKICEMLSEGFDVSDIYFYFKTDDETIVDRAFYILIFSIKIKKRHTTISCEYDIPDQVQSKRRPKFSEDDSQKIHDMILAGYRSIDIAKTFGARTTRDPIGKRITDKVRCMKHKMVETGELKSYN